MRKLLLAAFLGLATLCHSDGLGVFDLRAKRMEMVYTVTLVSRGPLSFRLYGAPLTMNSALSTRQSAGLGVFAQERWHGMQLTEAWGLIAMNGSKPGGQFLIGVKF